MSMACEMTATERNVPVFDSHKEYDQARGTYHYSLYLPKGYLDDPARRWPCMFIMAPNGGGNMPGPLLQTLMSSGYIVVAPHEAKNGSWVPIVGNLLAAHDDVIKRVRIHEGLKFATGFSGGARMAGLLAQMRPGFSGVILQGAGFPPNGQGGYHVGALRRVSGFPIAMIFGDHDNNVAETKGVKSALPSAHYDVLCFPGNHGWAPPELFSEALSWVEAQVYTEGPPRPELKPVYLDYFKKKQELSAALTSPWERYRDGDALLNFARARALTIDPAVAAPLRAVQAEVARLRTDPAIARDISAADAWRRLQEFDRSAPPQRFVADCRDFAKRYAGTEAAQKAEAKAAEVH